MFDFSVSEPLTICDEDRGDGPRDQTVEAGAAERLRRARLSTTRQRLDLMELLFTMRHRHVTAGGLCREAKRAGKRMSLATVYNTLNQFAHAGLLRRVAVGPEKVYFDTNVADHHHFYIDAEDRILDIPEGELAFRRMPKPPDGYVIVRIDVVVRLRRIPTVPCGGERKVAGGGRTRLPDCCADAVSFRG